MCPWISISQHLKVNFMYKMFKLSIFLCCLYIYALTPYSTSAMTADQKAQIHARFKALAKICIADYAISSNDIQNFRARKIPTGPNAPCFLACIMKHSGLMDDNGMVQKETALEHAKSIFNDVEELKIIEDYLHSCSHVNNEPVSDGEKGCERAILSYKCMTENASRFGFDV